MKLFKMAKAAIKALHKRRNRKRTGATRDVARIGGTRNAELLIKSNWGLSFKNPPAKRNGEARSAVRISAKRKANELIPSGANPTRQQLRAYLRASPAKLKILDDLARA